MVVDTSFGQWLKKRRKALDLTQQELAQRVGCAVITVQKIEASERRPSKQLADLLAVGLNIPIDERPAFVSLVRMEGGIKSTPESIQAADRLWHSLSPRCFTNLIAPPTPLIGRDQDVVMAHKRLLDGDTRLLTLVGPPGVGKTRLAIRIAACLLDHFEQGVYWVELAPIRDSNMVPAAIAQTLGVNESVTQSSADRIKEYLHDKHMLLVLDNFEQVVSAATFISQLLADCLWLSVLVTSRAPLRIRCEQQYPVQPLALLTEVGIDLDPTDLMRYSAIALFVERAQAVNPDFHLTIANARAVATICAHLDGLPLAIELVAAQTKILSPEALLERFTGQLILYTNGLRDGYDRHHTLKDALDWSYKLLTAEEQALIARLSVFVGGWTLDASDWLMNDVDPRPPLATLDWLTSLVNNSLVVRSDHAGQPRFKFLETIRTYALEKLAERGEEASIRQLHAQYYLALAEEADLHLRTADQKAWLDRLDIESNNLRAALAWFIDQSPDPQAGLRLTGALWWYWAIRGILGESRGWLAKALQIGSNAPPSLRARALYASGGLAWYQCDLELARLYFKESIALYREIEPMHKWELAFALTGLGMVATYQSDHDTARTAGEESLLLFHQAEDKWGAALALNVVAEACLMRHDYTAARSCFDESLALLREVGDKWAIGVPLLNYGYLDSILGDYDAARAKLEESIALHRQVGERWCRATTLNFLGQVAQELGDYQQAAACYTESLDLLHKMGLEASIADVLHNLAQVVQVQGHYALAIRLYQESLALFSKQGNPQGVARCSAGLATLTSEQPEAGDQDYKRAKR